VIGGQPGLKHKTLSEKQTKSKRSRAKYSQGPGSIASTARKKKKIAGKDAKDTAGPWLPKEKYSE
jgi:hypothetical protein